MTCAYFSFKCLYLFILLRMPIDFICLVYSNFSSNKIIFKVCKRSLMFASLSEATITISVFRIIEVLVCFSGLLRFLFVFPDYSCLEKNLPILLLSPQKHGFPCSRPLSQVANYYFFFFPRIIGVFRYRAT